MSKPTTLSSNGSYILWISLDLTYNLGNSNLVNNLDIAETAVSSVFRSFKMCVNNPFNQGTAFC